METIDTSLEVAADLFAVRELGPWLHTVLSAMAPEYESNDIVGPIELALHELCINIVEHSYRGEAGRIRLSVERDAYQLVFSVSDFGQPFDGDLTNTRDMQEQTIRGYGLAILQQLAASLDYHRADSSNCWRVAFALPASNNTNISDTRTSNTNKGMK
jgi:serine/threonine-protein kinase RsbW